MLPLLRFVPYARPMVWGGRRLNSHLGKPLPSDGAFGESWEVSAHTHHPSRVASGPLQGMTLRELMHQYRDELVGPQFAGQEFPWLFKFLDCRDWLSVQVHPDDALAHKLSPGEMGKTEAWFILDVEPTGRIYAGLKPGVTPRKMQEAIAAGTAQDLLHSFVPKPGDSVFLPAGTVHAVGGGVVMAEIQQSSDATYRLYDWNRVDAQGKSRELHVNQGLAAIDWSQSPVEPISVPQMDRADAGPSKRVLAQCPFFELSFVRQPEIFSLGGTGRLQLLAIVSGRGVIDGETFQPGDVALVPASMRAAQFQVESGLTALMCDLP